MSLACLSKDLSRGRRHGAWSFMEGLYIHGGLAKHRNGSLMGTTKKGNMRDQEEKGRCRIVSIRARDWPQGDRSPSSWGSRMICMGLTHCPLCVGLAVVAALRFCAHGWLLVSSGLLQGGAGDFSLGCLLLPRHTVRPDPARALSCN